VKNWEELLTSSIPLTYSKPMLAKTSQPIKELLLSLMVIQEKHLLKAFADIGTSKCIILEAYVPIPIHQT
jgi:hypothetical protein